MNNDPDAGGSASVLVSRAAGLGWITLNRPRALNAVTLELAERLERELEELRDGVNVIVLRGAGGNFSVGGDLRYIERARHESPEQIRELLETFGRVCEAVATHPVPIVAAVEGYALAGGFELMQASDIAIVRDDALIGDHHVNFGLVPGGGSTQRLPRLIGRQRALALMLTGDHLSGARAADWGLAYRSVPGGEFDAAIEELAGGLAAASRDALVKIKSLARSGLEGRLEDGLASEIEEALRRLQGDAAQVTIDEFASTSSSGTRTRG